MPDSNRHSVNYSGRNEEEEEDDDDTLDIAGVFPEGERSPSPPPSIAAYTSPSGKQLSIQLVNKHPLWGHVLYPTSICMGDYLTEHSEDLVRGKRVLELGAGGGLPSLVSALEGAAKTVVTDFPDAALLSNLQRNVDFNIPQELRSLAAVEGYTWGAKTNPLRALLATSSDSRIQATDLPSAKAFDTILAADLVFNHSQHLALLKSCEDLLAGSASPVLLCFYAHHRATPELIAKDEGFVRLAEERGWSAERVLRKTDAGPAFPEDTQYDLSIRSTVHGFKLRPPVNDLHQAGIA